MALRGEHLLIFILCLFLATIVASARNYPYETNEISVDGIYSSAVAFPTSACRGSPLPQPPVSSCCCMNGVLTCFNCR